MNPSPETSGLRELIGQLESAIGNPSKGLPEELFLFVSRLTPMVNVDLLIRNEQGQTLLTWREDEFYGPGWHVPGGIVRFKEAVSARIMAVAGNELGARIEFDSKPLAVSEIMSATRDNRGHFISLLYACRLASPPDARLQWREGPPRHGQWAWHSACPANLIAVHELYRSHIDAPDRSEQLLQ